MFTGKLNTMSLHPHHPSRNISNSISLVFKCQSRITFPTKVCERRRRRVHLNLIFTPNFPIELHPSVASIGGQTNIVSHCRGGGESHTAGGGEFHKKNFCVEENVRMVPGNPWFIHLLNLSTIALKCSVTTMEMFPLLEISPPLCQLKLLRTSS